jgi:hypothetical protein
MMRSAEHRFFIRHKAATLAAALLLALLAAPAQAWKIAESGAPFSHKSSGYSVQFPVGWKYNKLLFSDESGATRDGPALQTIFVDFRSHKSAFRAIKQKSSEAMLPQDLAQQLVADMTKERGLENVTTLADEPTELAGRPAFRLKFEYRLPVQRGAIRYREIIVGTVNEKGLYLVGYRAPVLHYFDRDAAVFDQTLATFAIAPVAARR